MSICDTTSSPLATGWITDLCQVLSPLPLKILAHLVELFEGHGKLNHLLLILLPEEFFKHSNRLRITRTPFNFYSKRYMRTAVRRLAKVMF